MAQPKPKKVVDQVLKLVNQLSPKEQESIMRQMKLQELKRKIMIAAEQLDRGEGIPAEEVFRELRERNGKLPHFLSPGG